MGKIEGGYEYENAGAPSNGVSEVQTLEFGGTPTGGTFKLAYEGQITSAITWIGTDDAALIAAIDAALEALATIGSGGVTVADGTLTAGIGTVTITFGGNLAKQVVPLISVNTNSLTGTDPTITITETTPGVTATARGAAVGAQLRDTTNANLYINTGTALEPTWTLVDRSEESAASATMVVGAEAADTINVAIQLKDGGGSDLAVRGSVLAYLSDDANGDSVAGTAPSGHVAVGTDGLAMHLVTDKVFLLTSESDGDIDLNIVEAGADTWYLVIVLPDGTLSVSDAITFAA